MKKNKIKNLIAKAIYCMSNMTVQIFRNKNPMVFFGLKGYDR